MRRHTAVLALLTGLAAACGAPPQDSAGDDTSDPTTDPLAGSEPKGIRVDDSFVSSKHRSWVLGGLSYLKVGAVTTNVHRAFLKFNVTGLPVGATSIVAKLVLRSQTTASNKINAHCGVS